MDIDKNLFKYDLAVAAIMKNEALYIKEWLDYHLLAGVEHFYLYDNGSTDNTYDIIKPYIDEGLIDFIPFPGERVHYITSNDAIARLKFICRYVAFIDLDEFILPKTNQSITELTDEILSKSPNAGVLSINWHVFGSNNLEKADYSKGLLERFTRRAPNNWYVPQNDKHLNLGNIHVKMIANPRSIDYIDSPHYSHNFIGLSTINEEGKAFSGPFNLPVKSNKMVLNHYLVKSREEFINKIKRGKKVSDPDDKTFNMDLFDLNDRNEEFDDGILKYRKLRQSSSGEVLENSRGGGYEKITRDKYKKI